MTYLPDCNWLMKPYQDSKENHRSITPSLFKRTIPEILKIKNSILFTIIFVAFAQVCWGQVDGDYRSKGSGNWNDVGPLPKIFAWEKFDGTTKTWNDATVTPGSSNNVTILNGHTIILDEDGYVKNLTIDLGGTISCNTTKNLSIYGNFTINGNASLFDGTITIKAQSTITGSIITFKNLTIDSGVTFSGGKSFNILGTMIVNGTFTPASGCIINNLEVNGSFICNSNGISRVSLGGGFSNQYKFTTVIFNDDCTIEYYNYSSQISSLNYKNLKINNNSGSNVCEGIVECTSLNIAKGFVSINPTGLLKVSGSTIINKSTGIVNCLILRSDESSTGSFVFNNFPTGTGIGTVLVERYMSKTDRWHLYSSPISDQSIHSFLQNNMEIPDLYDGSTIIGVGMCDYSTLTNLWNSYFVYQNASTLAGSIGGGKGFSIRTTPDSDGTGTISAFGLPNSNYVTIPLVSLGNRWNCIGNPFLCAINVTAFLTANSNLLDGPSFQAVYLWDNSLDNPDYISLNNSTSNKIQLGQGFFVKSHIVGGNISFTKTMQDPNPSSSFKSAQAEWPLIKIRATNQSLSSSTQIKFVTNTTRGLDPGYDAGMMKANPEFALYSKLLEDNGIDFTIQCLPDQDFDQYVIPIGIDFKAGGDITFIAETINLPSGCQALLEDRLTKRFTRLDLKDAKYTATVSANTKGTGRFFLHTSDVISGDQPIEKVQFKISKIGKTLYINGDVSDKAHFFVYSVNGKQLANFKSESQIQNQFDASGLPAGVYILTVDDQNQKKSIKFVIEN